MTYTIESTDKPVNCFRNQIILEKSENSLTQRFIIFGKKTRLIIQFQNEERLVETVGEVVNPSVVNVIKCDLPTLAHIQHRLIELFPSTQFRYSRKHVIDIFDHNEQTEIVVTEHNRAHRAAQENVKQILEDYYFPKMTKIANEVVSNCKTCSRAKYQRHPKKHIISETLIPSYAGEILHIDIYSTDRKHFLTCLDKFSKFAVVQPIQSRTINDVKLPIIQLMNIFPQTRIIFCDNEKSLNSETIKTILRDRFSVEIVNSPPLHSTSNGQVERFHSTLGEIVRCLKIERSIEDTTDLILQSTVEYKRTIHSITGRRPVDIIHSAPLELKEEIRDKIQEAQAHQLDYFNRTRHNRTFQIGEMVFVKNNRRLGNKLTPFYEEAIIEADMGTTVLIKGRVVHKDNLR